MKENHDKNVFGRGANFAKVLGLMSIWPENLCFRKVSSRGRGSIEVSRGAGGGRKGQLRSRRERAGEGQLRSPRGRGGGGEGSIGHSKNDCRRSSNE